MEMASLVSVDIVNDKLECITDGIDLGNPTPSGKRRFILLGAGIDPDTNNPIIKLEWEKNPNGSGVLFLDCDQADLTRVLNVRDELRARGVLTNFDEGTDLKKPHPVPFPAPDD